MSYMQGPDHTIEPVVDGIINLIRKNLAAKTVLIADAHVGDTTIYVNDTLHFEREEDVVLGDNNSEYRQDITEYVGVEWHQIIGPSIPMSRKLTSTTMVQLKAPLQKDFLVSDGAFLRKAVKRSWLFEKDVLYGDREVISFDQVAICVEPDAISNEWLALEGMLSHEYKVSLMVYVKSGTSGDQEETAMRICNGYARALSNLFISNIHLDIDANEVALQKDVYAGATKVVIKADDLAGWPPDSCTRYQLQDNFKTQFFLRILPNPEESSASSLSSSVSFEMSSSSARSSQSSANSQSSQTSSLSSSSASLSSSSSSESTTASQESLSSLSSPSSLSSLSSYPSTSSSSLGGELAEVFITPAARGHFRVSDKAVLRRMIRYLYDSRVSDATYGHVQKGSVLLKAAKLSWFGKETQNWSFPQISKGGSAY